MLTNVCDSKAVTFTGLRKTQFPSSNNSQSQRHTIRWLIKQTTGKEDEGFWHIIAKTMDKKIVERLRKKRKSDPIYEQPTNRREVRLLSKTGFFLEVLPSGKVGGNINKTKYSKFFFCCFAVIKFLYSPGLIQNLFTLFLDKNQYNLTQNHNSSFILILLIKFSLLNFSKIYVYM